MSVKLQFNWNYDDYLSVTGRDDDEWTYRRWVKVVSLIDNKHYKQVEDEIRSTIDFVDTEILEEEV